LDKLCLLKLSQHSHRGEWHTSSVAAAGVLVMAVLVAVALLLLLL
jgi:hypothetical protein